MKSEDIVARSTPLPARLELSFRSHGRRDLTCHAVDNAVFFGWMALLPAFLIGGMLWKFSARAPWSIVVGAAIVPAAIAYSLWRDYLKPATFWEQTDWLDFHTRTWQTRRIDTSGDAAPSGRTIAFDALGLVYFSRMWEQGPSFEVGICELAGWNVAGINSPSCLNLLACADTEDAALDCLFALTQRWGMGGWRWTAGPTATLDRLPEPALK